MAQYKAVPKAWGGEIWITNSPLYCGKVLKVMPGRRCSLHYHPVKDETFLCIEGRVKLEVGDKFEILDPLDSRHIPPGTPHRFTCISPLPATLVEFSTEHSDDDVVRLEPSA